MADLLLTAVEARVIAALSEKSISTPQYYPMTVNAIMLASNQKSSRDPVMQLHEGDVGAALLDLAEKGLAQRDDAGSRVPKWRQSFQHHLLLQPPAFAVLVTLILRGPQTPAELRANTERLHRFADISSVDGFLDELAARTPEAGGPLVVRLARAPGAREARWAQLLGGSVEAPAVRPADEAASGPEPVGAGEIAALRANQQRLQAELVLLRAQVQRLATELGVDLG